MVYDMTQFLYISIFLFLIGIFGIFLIRKNVIVVLMSIELMLLAININFMVFSVYLNDLVGQVFSLFVMTVAAGESAMGLAILVAYYSMKGMVSMNFINSMKG